MRNERRLQTGTLESRRFAERVQVVMGLTARLDALPFSDSDGRDALLGEILGRPLPATVRSTRRSTAITVGAGAVVASDVPTMTVVTGAGSVERRRLES